MTGTDILSVLGRLHTCRFKMTCWTWRDEKLCWICHWNFFSPEENELFIHSEWLLAFLKEQPPLKKKTLLVSFLYWPEVTEYQKHAKYSWNYSQNKRRATTLLAIYYRSLHKMCEKYVDRVILKLHSTTEDVVEVKAVKVILASLNVLYIV